MIAATVVFLVLVATVLVGIRGAFHQVQHRQVEASLDLILSDAQWAVTRSGDRPEIDAMAVVQAAAGWDDVPEFGEHRAAFHLDEVADILDSIDGELLDVLLSGVSA